MALLQQHGAAWRASSRVQFSIRGAVLTGIEAVRRSGLTSMLDRPAVAEIAERLGYVKTARWVRENPRAYARGIFRGFQERGR